VHPGPHGRLVFVVAELLAEDELVAEVALLVAEAAADVVLDDDEEPELHAESAAAAAASNPTDTAIPRRMITADSFRVWSFERQVQPWPQSPFHSHGAMTRPRMLPVRNNGPMPLVLILGRNVAEGEQILPFRMSPHVIAGTGGDRASRHRVCGPLARRIA
jgi:hypothetical protein